MKLVLYIHIYTLNDISYMKLFFIIHFNIYLLFNHYYKLNVLFLNESRTRR
jgi:hypothetical protein